MNLKYCNFSENYYLLLICNSYVMHAINHSKYSSKLVICIKIDTLIIKSMCKRVNRFDNNSINNETNHK